MIVNDPAVNLSTSLVRFATSDGNEDIRNSGATLGTGFFIWSAGFSDSVDRTSLSNDYKVMRIILFDSGDSV